MKLGAGFGFFLLLLLTRAIARAGTPAPLAKQAEKAHDVAKKKREKAQKTGLPEDHAAAREATQQANVLTKAAKTAAATPAPWPQATPKGLPVFPAGWQPDEPPPLAVQSRASQLLPGLWARGAGTRKTEKTQGRWITYQATPMGKKKGVVAYRVRPEFLTAPSEAAPVV